MKVFRIILITMANNKVVGKQRPNLKNERKYEQENKSKRNASKKIKTPIRQKARDILEKKLGRKLRSWETVGHKVPLSKWGSNAASNLFVQKAKANFADWWKQKHKRG